MPNTPLRAGAFVVGGLFLGVWLYLGLFRSNQLPDIDVGLWWFWGAVGLAIAGGLYAGRVANAPIRITIWVALGIAVGMLIAAALFQRVGEALAAIFTAVGGAIIVSGLPGMTDPDA
jgi:hypothetical protein